MDRAEPLADTALRVTDDPSRAAEWALVLEARGYPYRIERVPGVAVLVTPAEAAASASSELSEYEAEQRAPRPAPEPEAAAGGAALGALFGALVLALALVTGPFDPASPWFARGAADAARLLHGEAYRAVTALTLHADLEHAAGNAVIGGALLAALGRRVGLGVGAWAALAAGASGNLLNAVLHHGQHLSVGGSTAVFGVVGTLAALRAGRGVRPWVAAGAGLALLAALGTGERADLGAHLLGALSGAALGLPLRWLPPAALGRSEQAALALGALVATVGGWALALG